MAFSGKIDAIKHVRDKYYARFEMPSATASSTVVYYERPGLKEAKDLVEDIMQVATNTDYNLQLISNLRNELAAERLKLSKLLITLEDALNISKRIGY